MSARRLLALSTVLALGAGPLMAGPVGYDAVIRMYGPAAWWKLDDASTTAGSTAVDSAGGADGTYYGSTGQVTGVVGQAASLDPGDGADYVRAFNVPMTDSLSVAVWATSTPATWNTYGWLASERAAK